MSRIACKWVPVFIHVFTNQKTAFLSVKCNVMRLLTLMPLYGNGSIKVLFLPCEKCITEAGPLVHAFTYMPVMT